MGRPAFLRALGLLALAGLGATASMAQPVRLTPVSPATEPAANQESPAPVPQSNTMPAGTRPMESQAQDNKPAETKPGETGVRIEALSAPDPSSTGLLGDDNGGLSIKMWSGTARAQAERVISLLPAPVSSPGLRLLQRRLLLTTAEAPSGGQAAPSLLGLRVEQLYRLGAVAEATQLGIPRPAALKDAIFTRLPIEQALLKNDTAAACALGAQALREDPSAAAWLQLAVFCRYKAGDVSGGDLALNLWRDQGGDDRAFQALAAALRGDTRAKVESLGNAGAVSLAMLRETKRPLPQGMLDIAPPMLLQTIAELPGLEPDTRLVALERGVALGAVPLARLISGYSQLEISDTQRADIASGKIKGARAAASLFNQVRELPPGPARAEALKRAYDLASARGTLFVTAAALREALRDLPAVIDNPEAAGAVIRLALAAGENGTARLWRNTLLGNSDAKAVAAAAKAWPLLLLAEPAAAWPEAQFQAWSATLDDQLPARKAALQALMLILAEGSGVGVPAETWQALAQPGLEASTAAPPVAYWRNLLRAAESGSKAETVALALTLLGGDGMAKADPASLATAFGALKRVKLEAEVRALALEAALARGL